MLVLTDLLNGGLNQIMFLWRLPFVDGVHIYIYIYILIEPFYIIVTDLDKPRHVANCERSAKATMLVNKVT